MLINRNLLTLTIFIYIFKTNLSRNADKCDINLQFISRLYQTPPEKQWTLPPGFQTTEDLIRSNGFDYEKHSGKTEDGYIITYHRIKTNIPGGQPVFIQHGFALASDHWLLNGRKTDLGIINAAFRLADAGYDVWLGDRRGNWYSREHEMYKPNTKEFWDFSFHESALYDLPVFIDGIISSTKHSEVIFIGHSMGCAEFMVLTSLRPEYNDKIKLAILLAPVAVTPPLNELKSPFLRLSIMSGDSMYRTMLKQGKYELEPREAKFVETFRKCCGPSSYFQPICLTIFGFSFGEHRSNYNMTLIGDKLAHFPGGASIKTESHMKQIFKSGFASYDYGSTENLRRYNSTTPPIYPLERVTAPVAIYWGGNDAFLNQKAINRLTSRLANVIEVHKVEDPMFNHMDYFWGMNTNSLVNEKVIEFLERFNQ